MDLQKYLLRHIFGIHFVVGPEDRTNQPEHPLLVFLHQLPEILGTARLHKARDAARRIHLLAVLSTTEHPRAQHSADSHKHRDQTQRPILAYWLVSGD